MQTQPTEFWHGTRVPLESRRSCQEIACYRPHTHDRFSIGLIDSGTTVFAGAAGPRIRLTAGDVILIPAGHVHACNPDQGRWRYQMIQADQDWLATLMPGPSTDLLAAITVFRAPELSRRFGDLNDRLFDDAAPDVIAADLRAAFGACAATRPERRLAPATDAELLARLRPVLDRLRRDASNPKLDELAEVAGMSKFQLIRVMKRTTGLSPLAWRQNYRVVAAREMLRDGHSLADTACALGFVDQSHFHRVFRAHVAASPGSYRG